MRSGDGKPAHGREGKISGGIQEVDLDESSPDVVVSGIQIFNGFLVV